MASELMERKVSCYIDIIILNIPCSQLSGIKQFTFHLPVKGKFTFEAQCANKKLLFLDVCQLKWHKNSTSFFIYAKKHHKC